MVAKNRNPPWSDLPQELLSTIANSLTSDPISIFTFRSVCRSWRSSCPPLSNSPLLSPLLPLPVPSTSYHSFDDSSGYSILSVTVIYALYRPLQLSQPGSSSPDAWILFVDEFISGKLGIRKPFSNESYFTPINFPTNINLIDSNVRELGRFHNFSYSTYYNNDGNCKLSKPRFCVSDVNKVVMFPNVSAAIALRDDGTLEMYRLDVGINDGIIECENKHDGKGFRFDDIVEFKGRVLGVDRRGKVYEIKYHSSKLTPFVAPIWSGGGRRKRLVESLGRLYMVVRCYVDPGHYNKMARYNIMARFKVKEEIGKIKFKVYELNEGKKKWIEISSLGDRSFSFGRNFSFSASTKELGTSVKNCIFFTRHSFLSYSSNDDDFTGFKNSELDIGVCHLHEADHFGDIESYPGYSDSLWPPPNWLWSIDRLNRITILESAIEGILDKVPENYKTDVERADDPPNPAVLEFVKVILKLKKMVIKFQEEEIACKNKLQQATDELNQVDDLFEQTKTWSRATIAETYGIPDYCKMSQACRESFLRLKLGILRMDSHLFDIEEFFTEVEMSLTSRLAPIVTLAQ